MDKDCIKWLRQLDENGFVVIDNILKAEEVDAITQCIENVSATSSNAKVSNDLFAIRNIFKELPALKSILFNSRIKWVVENLFGNDYFVVKGLFFDKPPFSNWFVSYHQDLSVSVDRKEMIAGFGPWTVKNNQFGVQPPLEILESIYTIRIHLDDCTRQNGALQVIPGSHKKGVIRTTDMDLDKALTHICEVPKAGIMIMRPLLLHASGRSIVEDKRRVVHIEFCNKQMPVSINWAEQEMIFK